MGALEASESEVGMAEGPNINQTIERNIAMELVRVTEAAALCAARHMGRGDKNLVDQEAVTAMRYVLGHVAMDGIVVIGEGEKDEAPMLYIGEHLGDASPPLVDIAVDPIDGTSLCAKGLPGAISAVALAERGAMHCPERFFYMDKIVTGPEARDYIDINAPVAMNLKAIAAAKHRKVTELTVVVLDRPRHDKLLAQIRGAGARVKLISDGDVAAAIEATMPDREVDALMGIGGTPEAVLSAAAIRCLGGAIQCKAWPRDDGERRQAEESGVDVDKVYRTEDLVSGEEIFFAATGVSSGVLLKGVRYFSGGAQTNSVAMRNKSGTIRWVDSWHNFQRLDKLSDIDLH